jgi:hypothetical protein
MLILSNEEIESFLSIKTCIDALENAYRSWEKGTAINRPRTDLVMPSATESGVYAFKSMEAGLYDPPIVAMRINSDIIRWKQQDNRVIKTKIPSLRETNTSASSCCFRRTPGSHWRCFRTALCSACG